MDAGEKSKQMSVLTDLLHHLVREKIGRDDMILTLGGGVVGDLGGFAAAIYQRGIRFGYLPTTLLAMVDSCIGGKTGVDLDSVKTMVGAFHQPSFVYADLNTLRTLPEDTYRAGLAEVLKMAWISDPDFADMLDERIAFVLTHNDATLEEMIRICMRIKSRIVAEDPYDHNERQALNFGHTIGHALESALDFSWPHGSCVAVGMVAASHIARARGELSSEDYMRMLRTLERYGLPRRAPKVSEDRILQAVRLDKKNRNGSTTMILPKKIGEVYRATDISETELRNAIHAIS